MVKEDMNIIETREVSRLDVMDLVTVAAIGALFWFLSPDVDFRGTPRWLFAILTAFVLAGPVIIGRRWVRLRKQGGLQTGEVIWLVLASAMVVVLTILREDVPWSEDVKVNVAMLFFCVLCICCATAVALFCHAAVGLRKGIKYRWTHTIGYLSTIGFGIIFFVELRATPFAL